MFTLTPKLVYTFLAFVTMSHATKTTTVAPFNLTSPPGTDIWRKPPSHNVFTAPTHPAPIPLYGLETFLRARLTLALPPGNELRQYDQGGLVLHFTKPGLPEGKDKWLKTGIEWYYGKPYISTVGCDAWADWSIVPLSNFSGNTSRPTVEIEARRERDQLGKSLWVYQIVRDQGGKEIERRPLREVNWVFAEEEGWSVGVGGYVARPTQEGGDGELKVEFGSGVDIEVLDPEKKL
jgi:regulation of enolase protein 1 (concanavalin A-like superfamily)